MYIYICRERCTKYELILCVGMDDHPDWVHSRAFAEMERVANSHSLPYVFQPKGVQIIYLHHLIPPNN